ncbi:hypothetical protein BDA96_10G307900 [Sorghum bicolor]|uniref:Regulator of Vps4 activity in the MVB pathway protein n=1 Tax=Sorghum bicolor TaxID=4558 RepID=A0A921Q576_SORBI|nr:hypothetical protein BDA96_10G307900 [Sorghum bicolor]
MFDSLLNSKFYNKCKHAFKCIRTRMAPIRRKKHAMIRFLKKDVADLLANGLDTHAFGRMDGLIVELNHASCYDMIEGFCDYIGKQLGSLQKQRECPPEFREAVSTLIFAAARYPDLPELCDLRHIFTERYGNFVEHFVNREFIWKLDSTEFTNEERFQVMQSVAEELSVSFDAKELQLKLWATPETEHDMVEKGSRKPAELSMPLSNKQRCVKDAPYEEQEDILEKSSRKPAELAMPLFDKTKCEGDAPCERKNKDMLENYSIKPVELATASSNKQKVTEDVPCKRNCDAEPAYHTEKVEIQLIQKDIQAVADAHHTIDEHSRKQQPDVSDEKEDLQKPVSPVDTNRRNTQKDVQKLNRRAVRPLEKELMEAVELDLNGLPKNGFGAVKFPETDGNKSVQLNVKPNEAVRDYHIEKENNKVLHARMPGGPEHNGRHADSGLRVQRPDNQGRPVSPLSGNTRNKAPYTKRNVANMKNPTEKQANSGFLHDKPQHLADLGYPVQKGQGVPERAGTMLPPYVKPKSNMQPVNDDPEKKTPSGYSKPNIPGQTDHLENKDVLRPVSVRRRTAKLPAPVDTYVEVPNNEKVTSQTPKSHRSHSSRQNGAKYDQNRKCNGTDDVGRGTNAQITPGSQSKHIGRRNGTLNHINDYGRLMQRRQPEADETAIDFGNLLPQNANGQRRHNSGHNGDLDEEDRMMDKLLMHYSKKKGSDPTNNEGHIDAVQKVSLHPPGRAISLPPESVGPGEDAKVPARSTSLQPDGPKSAHVHPKMPDFDELAARVKALRKAA